MENMHFDFYLFVMIHIAYGYLYFKSIQNLAN